MIPLDAAPYQIRANKPGTPGDVLISTQISMTDAVIRADCVASDHPDWIVRVVDDNQEVVYRPDGRTDG